MPKGQLFFIFACIIMVLTTINLGVGPIINKKVGTDSIFGNWGTANCAYFKDKLEEAQSTSLPPMEAKSGKYIKYHQERYKDECRRKKAMYNLEYTSSIFNIIIGFICALLSFLHLQKLNKDFIPKTGLIGAGCGIVGFIITLVYVIHNGIVYTNYYDYDSPQYKKDSYGIFAQLNGDKYECFYHDEPANEHSIIAKYSDLNKKQYNYNRDLLAFYQSGEVIACRCDPEECLNGKEIPVTNINKESSPGEKCKYLYVDENPEETLNNKDIGDRFLTSLILNLFVCFANIGLVISGLLFYKNPVDFAF